MSPRVPAKARGFTLIETIMAMASVGVVGLSIFYTLYYGLLLFTKNTAMNVSGEEARLAMQQLDTDIHSAVSIVSLTDSNGNMVSGTSASAGVEFQVMLTSTDYCQVSGSFSAGAGTVNVALPSGYPTPYVGARLIIPAFELEADLTAVSVSGSIATCTLDETLANPIDGTDNNVPCFFTQRVYYYVNGPPDYTSGSVTITPPLTLTYIGLGRTKTYSVGSDNLTTRYPFSIPCISGSANDPNYHAVTVTGLSAEDPQASNLDSIFHFTTSNIMLGGTIPAYSVVNTLQ